MRVLFLDFDGVLHPVPAVPTNRVVNGKPVMRAIQVLPFEWLPVLAQLLRPHPDVRLIVHSSWRLVHTPSRCARDARRTGLPLPRLRATWPPLDVHPVRARHER